MSSLKDKHTECSRTRTDESLRAERNRSDDELLTRSLALSEDADAVIARARERSTVVLELARHREDSHLIEIGASSELRYTVRDERRTEDAAVAEERAVADSERVDERERRRAAMMLLLAFERSVTDQTLADERRSADHGVSGRQDLLAVVAHDLRTMLTTIVVNASIAVMTDETRTAAMAAGHIQRASAQMSAVLEDLLTFSSFEAGNLALDVSEVDVVAIVEDAVSLHEQVANEAGLALSVHARPAPIRVRADVKRLMRLLFNLIGNAVKFTPAGGRIDVTVSVTDGECEIAIADTGVGVATHLLDSIFERFRQVGREPRRTTGVGLGLYIARLIAEAHGGRIWAESEPSMGTTFRVRLPMAAV